ncbi:MAG: peptide deformylase [Gemmatimonadota bacterium]|nr:MAG: peptide deformylase [Gemmatimonadota bacterium]
MSIRQIRYLGDEVLRAPGEAVSDFDDDLRTLVKDMFETMYHAEGIGLAAPQIGLSLRVCVLDVHDDESSDTCRLALVNPEVVRTSRQTEKATEGCLSIPGLEEFVTRPARVTVRAADPDGESIEVEAEGLLARALQHELDHLDGVLFIDRVSPLKRRILLKKWKKSQEEAGG